MATVIADRVQETTNTIGTGTLELNGAVAGFRTIVAAIGDGSGSYFVMTDGTDWEVFIGTVSAGAPDTLSRDTVLASSNNGAKVSWPAGTKRLWLGVPAAKSLFLDPEGTRVENLPPAFHEPAVEEALARLGVAPVNLRAPELAGALALHLYDPTRDSDGGAWLERCAGTSWWREVATEGVMHGRLAVAPSGSAYDAKTGDLYYDTTAGAWKKYDGAAWNTTTRGCTRIPRGPWLLAMFSTKLVIYDAGDPALPMWMVATKGSSNWLDGTTVRAALAARDGIVLGGTSTGGLRVLDFILDAVEVYYTGGILRKAAGIAGRDDGVAFLPVNATGIVNSDVRSAAIAALQDAPADPARLNLPRPTFAVGTAGGLSLIKDDGNIYDSSATAVVLAVGFLDERLLWAAVSPDARTYLSGKVRQVMADSFNAASHSNEQWTGARTAAGTIPLRGRDAARGTSSGLSLASYGRGGEMSMMTALITRTYNTGWGFGGLNDGIKALYPFNDSQIADRSNKGNNLTQTGIPTVGAVAAGAELYRAFGFSNTAYFSRAYDADFDFGTGDWSIKLWFKRAAITNNEYMVMRAYHTGGAFSGSSIELMMNGAGAGGYVEGYISDDGRITLDAVSTSSFTCDDDQWHQAVLARDGSLLKLYIDGTLVSSATITEATGSLSNANATLMIGERQDLPANAAWGGSLALISISAVAPTAEQVRRAFAEEAPLFRANAKALISGTAAQVDALAFDPDTCRLHASGGDGTSVFRGLERVDYIDSAADTNLTTDDHDAVAAGGGARVIGTSSEGAAERDPAGALALMGRQARTPPVGPDGFIPGGMVPKFRGHLAVTAALVLGPEHEGLVVTVNTNASTLTLPQSTNLPVGWSVTVRRGSANATLSRSGIGADTIAGRGFVAATSITLGEPGETVTVMNAGGAVWAIVADTIGPNSFQTEITSGVDITNDSLMIYDSDAAKTRLVRPANLGLGTSEGSAKGWVAFDQTGTLAILDSFNVTGVTDVDVGRATVTWDTDFASGNYAVAGSCGYESAGSYQVLGVEGAPVAGSVGVGTYHQSGGSPVYVDLSHVSVTAFGDQ